jgi:hypothetical protein
LPKGRGGGGGGRRGPPPPPRLHRWHEIVRATWADGHLTVEAMDRTPTAYRLTEPRGVPPAVREHVDATVIVSEQHQLDGTGLRVVARRDLRTGALHWSAVFDAATVPDESQRGRADDLVAAVRRRFGDALR